MADQSPTISRDLFKNIIATNEVGSLALAYVLSHAGTANSGYSVGAFQLGFAQQSDARSTAEDFLSQSGAFSGDEMATISQGFVTKGNPDAIDAALKESVNTQFSTDSGKAMIDGLDAEQLDVLMGNIASAQASAQANPRYATDAAFKAFSDGDLFQALIGDNANQYGPPNTFGRYIQCETVTNGGDSLQLGDNHWDFAAFAAYEAHYKYVRASEQGASDMRRRRTNVVNILTTDGVLTAEEQTADLAIIQSTYQATG